VPTRHTAGDCSLPFHREPASQQIAGSAAHRREERLAVEPGGAQLPRRARADVEHAHAGRRGVLGAGDAG
jgi:hypothetical protein